MDSAIVTEHLTKRFGSRTVVDNLDLDVRVGQVFGFLGPNGAGKTTTIGMLLGLVKPTAGRALVLGHDVAREPTKALARVGALIEAVAFYPYLSARDNLRALVLSSGIDASRINIVLELVGLTERAGDKVKTYSQGMRQRLGIAAALLNDPLLILLDEPTNALDPAGQLEMRALIRSLAEQGHTIFLSSHLLHEVEQMCDQVAILKQGQIVVSGTVSNLLRRGRGVLVRVVGDITVASKLLHAESWIGGVEQHDNALLVDVPLESAPQISALLAAHGITIAEIRANEQRLEDFFLEVTKEAPRVAGIHTDSTNR